MLFGTRTGKLMNEGDLIEKFFQNYKDIKKKEDVNIGWELIFTEFSEDFK
jgi:hypothetical protein